MTSENRGPQVTGVASFFLAASTVGVLLRCYCRIVVVKSFGVDDYCSVISWIFFALFCSFAMTGVKHGTGQHADVIPPAEIPVGLKWWWACEPFYVLSNMALKLSIGIFLLRIAVARSHRMVIWVVLVVVEVYSAVYFLLFVMQCLPAEYFWTQYTGGKGTCMPARIIIDATYAYSAVSCWADWTLGILPVLLVWNLQMNMRTKLSVAVILAIGAIASTATIVRIPYVKDLGNKEDFLYATTDVAIWSTSETGIGLAASSFATLRPLFRNFFLRSNLLGGSSTRANSSPWPQYNGPNSGYIKSKGRGTADDIILRDDMGKGSGITTTINGDGDQEHFDKNTTSNHSNSHRNKNTAAPFHKPGSWEDGGRKTTGSSSDVDDDSPWMGGITKTIVSTQQVR